MFELVLSNKQDEETFYIIVRLNLTGGRLKSRKRIWLKIDKILLVNQGEIDLSFKSGKLPDQVLVRRRLRNKTHRHSLTFDCKTALSATLQNVRL